MVRRVVVPFGLITRVDCGLSGHACGKHVREEAAAWRQLDSHTKAVACRYTASHLPASAQAQVYRSELRGGQGSSKGPKQWLDRDA